MITEKTTVDQSTHDFYSLLERAGFEVRGTRANCPFCEGSSRLTVRIGPGDVYYCHRCKCSGNSRTLARQLRIAVAPESPEVRHRRERKLLFEAWCDRCQKILLSKLTILTLKAESAKKTLEFLVLDPKHDALAESEWDELAHYYDAEAEIFGALELLSFEKVPVWIETPMKEESLFRAFEGVCP